MRRSTALLTSLGLAALVVAVVELSDARSPPEDTDTRDSPVSPGAGALAGDPTGPAPGRHDAIGSAATSSGTAAGE